METAKLLDFDAVKYVRKRRTFLSRNPNTGGPHTLFFNEQDHSTPSAPLPLDPRNVVYSDKGSNDATCKYLNSHSHGDDCKRVLGNINIMGRFEIGKDDLGRSLKSGYRMASGDNDSVRERVEIKRVRREFADLSDKHLGSSPDGDRSYDRVGTKSQDYEHSRSSEKSSREKNLRDSKEFKEYMIGEKVERERSRFIKTFKRMRNGNNLDRSKRFREDGMERRDSYERHGSHERLEHDRDRDQGQDIDRSLEMQGSVKSSKDGQGLGHSHKPVVVVGFGAGGTSGDFCNSDRHKVLEKRSLDYNPSHVRGGLHSEHSRLPDESWREEGRSMDGPNVGLSNLASEGPNGGQVKTAANGRTSDSRDPDMKALAKSELQQDDIPSQQVRLKKMKAKLGVVTHTVHANSSCNAGEIKKRGVEGSSVSLKPPHATESRSRHQRLILQENSYNEDYFPARLETHETPKKKPQVNSCASSAKYFPARVETHETPKKKPQVNSCASSAKLDIHHVKENQNSQLEDEVTLGKQAKLTNNVVEKQPVRKSSRIPKKRVLDGEHFGDDAEKALQHQSSRTMKKCIQNGKNNDDEECDSETFQCRSSRIPKKRMLDAEYEEDNEMQQHKRKGKRSKYQTDSEHMYNEDAALGDEDVENADVDLEGVKKRSKRIQQRTMQSQSCKDAGSEVEPNLIEFPEGLMQTSRGKRKEKLSEVEQQLKKTEAAQRRKARLEKAENAAQAEAIKKILGKDSSSKKRGDKLQKQRDAMAQKKAASTMLLASNGVKWVMGPSGTVVSFSENIGLPSIFNNTCRYPPPREKCAGPLCNNTYKYRDSGTNLPLCSLQCYRAIHGVKYPVSTC